jgi:hypothetical protein
MNIYHTINNLEVNNITVCNPIANKFSNYDKFYKIIYNLNGMTLNSIFLLVDIDYLNVTQENNKYRYFFNVDENTIDKIKKIEMALLDRVNQLLQKEVVLNCHYNLINNKCIYSTNVVSKKNKKIYIRISGIWETDTQIGLTTKMTLLE